MLTLLLLLISPGLSHSEYGGSGDVRDSYFQDFLTDSQSVQCEGKDFLHVGMILAGIQGSHPGKRPILVKLEEMVESVLRHSRGSRLCCIVFTDSESRPYITAVIRNEMGRFLSETVLRDRRMVAFPRLKVEYVDLSAMVSRHREYIDQMKKLFGYHHPEGTVIKSKDGEGPVMIPTQKYTKDLFYIAPLLHRELPPHIERLIMLDIDLEFRIDMRDLHRQFDQFSDTELIGLGMELSPHYYNQARAYISENPGTLVGTPGRFQGFNTGIALYSLARMRESEVYGEETRVERMKALSHYKYKMAGTVGDQDWLTVLGWERPHLFHLLPCEFNVQTHQGYNTPEWAALWGKYRNCTGKPKIIHKNGSFWKA